MSGFPSRDMVKAIFEPSGDQAAPVLRSPEVTSGLVFPFSRFAFQICGWPFGYSRLFLKKVKASSPPEGDQVGSREMPRVWGTGLAFFPSKSETQISFEPPFGRRTKAMRVEK